MDYKIFFREKFLPDKNIAVPYFNFYEEQKHINNILKNNFYTEETKINILNYLKDKFFENNKTSLFCPNRNKCFEYSYQNDFEYNLCKDMKSLSSFSFFEIIFIILLFIILINVIFF